MAKAPHDGTYTNANGDRFVIRAGDPLPDGGVMDTLISSMSELLGEDRIPEPEGLIDSTEEDEPEERAKPKAPQNKAKAKAAPENRAAE